VKSRDKNGEPRDRQDSRDSQDSLEPFRDRAITVNKGDPNAPAHPARVEFSEPLSDVTAAARAVAPKKSGRASHVRCPVHGLHYNPDQASGCVRCLADARMRSNQLLESGVVRLRGGADASLVEGGWSVRTAFVGLAVGVLLGLWPAAYYVRRVVADDVSHMREEQRQLGTASPTREQLMRFDLLDASVESTRRRAVGTTVLIWSAIAGATTVVVSVFKRRR